MNAPPARPHHPAAFAVATSIALACLGPAAPARAEVGPEGAASSAAAREETLRFDTEWKGERIALPPTFAPDMGLEGLEEIRFAPGMFDADAADFFSYIFVFSVPSSQVLDAKRIRAEMLTYYRGLARSVSKSKGEEVDTAGFTFTLKEVEDASHTAKAAADPKSVEAFHGELDWVEPFTTGERQRLRFELHAWSDESSGRSYLLACTSPRKPTTDDPVWTQLRKIRASFTTTPADR